MDKQCPRLLTAEQERRDGEGRKRERASSRRWSRRRSRGRGITLVAAAAAALLLGGERERESTHAKRHAEKPETPRPLSRVGSGLVWSPFRESTTQSKKDGGMNGWMHVLHGTG
ncbi:hypothetical protein BO78DRAFT_396155 [Aspergillus sclerotiicarbonarius CBS 121057]|uniref:Uncharacterized protein n=1 Tax=Aspergillus sclerotiicarbonarius (strain CBS 121057 / IBT 28362) TaxID=1448318 RepID=A0A319EE53_ASPSB|nr:hypothetical protein BO78DRAFT_396155 [Aspergillus sclerotiicarbonarius CBS 121057]